VRQRIVRRKHRKGHGRGHRLIQLARIAQRTHQAVMRLNRMVQDLLDLSQLEARRMVLVQENVDLASLVARAVELVAPQATDRRFEVRVYGDAPFVALDPDRISQVVENLLSNAVKYGSSESPILVEIDTTGAQVGVAVTNEGAGIDPAELPHLFNRFYRVEGGARVKGVGLGLYIARELVEAFIGTGDRELATIAAALRTGELFARQMAGGTA